MKDRIASITKSLVYGGLDKKGYEDIRPNIDKKNYDFLLWLTRCSALILSGLTVLSVFFDFLHDKQLFYLIFSIFATLFYLASRYVLNEKSHLTMVFMHFFVTVAYMFGIFISVWLNKNTAATTFCVLLFALPLIIIDRPYRINTIQVLATVIFCICSYSVKSKELFTYDIINSICFVILGMTVSNHLVIARIADIVNRKYIEMERDTDELTQLMSRAAAEKIIGSYTANARDPAAFLMIDVDDYKSINDTYGHIYGDMVLTMLGECLRDAFRKTDVLARFGGDEIIVFLRNISSEDDISHCIQNLWEKISADFKEKALGLTLTLSIGVALFPKDGSDFESLFFKADKALYIAKETKNRTVFYQE